jgi:hypothetical protein
MSRNRIFYPTQALFVGPTPSTGQHYNSGNSGINAVAQLHRIQSVNYSFNVTRTDVNQFSSLAAIGREIIQQPTVNLSFSYYVANVANEYNMGFYVSGDQTAVKNLLNKTADDKNYFLSVAPEGENYYGWTGNYSAIAIGNGFISSYSTEGSVGSLPTANVSVEALNINFDTGVMSGPTLPAVNPVNGLPITTYTYTLPTGTSGTAGAPAALRHGDIEMTIGQAALGVLVSDAKIQSYNISYDLARENLEKLGSRFAFSKEITFPVTVSLAITANIGDLTTGKLSNILATDEQYTVEINLREPNIIAGTGPIAAKYILRNLKIDSQDFSNDIGSSASVTLNLSTQLGGPTETDKGFFISGKR